MTEPKFLYACAACGNWVFVQASQFLAMAGSCLVRHCRGENQTFPGDEIALVCWKCSQEDGTAGCIASKKVVYEAETIRLAKEHAASACVGERS